MCKYVKKELVFISGDFDYEQDLCQKTDDGLMDNFKSDGLHASVRNYYIAYQNGNLSPFYRYVYHDLYGVDKKNFLTSTTNLINSDIAKLCKEYYPFLRFEEAANLKDMLDNLHSVCEHITNATERLFANLDMDDIGVNDRLEISMKYGYLMNVENIRMLVKDGETAYFALRVGLLHPNIQATLDQIARRLNLNKFTREDILQNEHAFKDFILICKYLDQKDLPKDKLGDVISKTIFTMLESVSTPVDNMPRKDKNHVGHIIKKLLEKGAYVSKKALAMIAKYDDVDRETLALVIDRYSCDDYDRTIDMYQILSVWNVISDILLE